MPDFTSPRERRLWMGVLAVVLAIYATLGLTPTLAEELRDRELQAQVFMSGLGVVMVGFTVQALRVRARGVEIGMWLAIAAVYLMVFQRMALPEERTHLFEYTVVALLIHEALLERQSNGKRVPRPGLVAFGAASVVGVVDELLQLPLPNRFFDKWDISFNVFAAAMAISGSVVLRRIRRRYDERSARR